MAYTATVIPVMIASPGDVADERQVIRDVIHEWNDINSARSKVMLTPVGWETHTSPELGVRPQELINQRLLVECDLLIGVFWTRLGSPTGNESSGTVEEIYRHLDANKPAMIYFSAKPVAPDTIDVNQHKALTEFKAECMSKGLIEHFENLKDFKHQLYKQLSLTLAGNEYLQKLINENGNTGLSIAEKVSEPAISDDALYVLRVACETGDGSILMLNVLAGTIIQVGSQVINAESARELARWKSAIKELQFNGLIIAQGYKGEVFEVTHKGWSLFESQ